MQGPEGASASRSLVRKRLLLLVISLGLALVAAELLFRVGLIWTAGTPVDPSQVEQWDRLPDGRYFGLRADYQGKGGFLEDADLKFDYRTNALRLRGPEIGPRRPGVPRVLMLGDSYTFGWAVSEQDALPAQLERLLSEPGHEVEVVNGGVPGYNTEQEAVLLEHLLPAVQPDIVVLGFVMNDAEPISTSRPPPQVTYRFARSWLWEALKQQIRQRWPASAGWLPSRLNNYDTAYLHSFDPASPKRVVCRAALAKIVERLRRDRIPALIVIFPDFTMGFGPGYPFVSIHQAVAGWCEELGVDHVDLLDSFRGMNSGRLKVAGDGHPGPEAYARVATVLRPWIEAHLAASAEAAADSTARSEAIDARTRSMSPPISSAAPAGNGS